MYINERINANTQLSPIVFASQMNMQACSLETWYQIMAQKIFKDSNGNDIPVIYDKLPPVEEAVYRKNTLKTGMKLNDNALTLPCNIIEEKDVAASLSDGTKIYTDVFRPDNSQKVPAVIAWSPYGKETFHFQ